MKSVGHRLLVGSCFMIHSIIFGMQKIPVFVDVNALVDHSETKKAEIIARRLDGFYVPLASDAWVGRRLWNSCNAVAVVREQAEVREREAHVGCCDFTRTAHLKFYGLMDGVTVPGTYPTIRYKGDVLPPAMAGWAWGDISTEELMRLTDAYIETFDCDDAVKKFFHKLVYVAFDPEVMKTTCFVKPEMRAFLDRLRKKNFPAYLVLIGHCNPATLDLMRTHKEGSEILPTFDRIVFSHQVRDRVTNETQFTDDKWRELAGVGPAASVGSFAMPHLFIDDEGAPLTDVSGKSVVQPWHYTSSSKELKALVENAKT